MNLSPLLPAVLACVLAVSARAQTTNVPPITREDVRHAERIIGLDFSDAKIDLMLPTLQAQLRGFELLRKVPLTNSVVPAVLFNPLPVGFKFETARRAPRWSAPGKVKLPADEGELAFLSVGELGALLKSRQLTSERLTRLYLERLKKFGPRLECVVTLTEEHALARARQADKEIAAGKYRGPLHGIPYGVKDLLATRVAKTTWGSAAYREQFLNEDATVVQRLDAAGAVLVAKLSMGELAWDDVWFGGKTRNPWNPEQGSSGSSAGSGSATAAGLVGFSIGSETWGSIMSPATRCGVTGLRPTYGRVSRTGAMTLSWTMDKLGPICRTAEDCALVLHAIQGPDGRDQTLYDAPFNYDARVKLSQLRVGYVKREFDLAPAGSTNDAAALEQLRALGAKLIPVELPAYPIAPLSFLLLTESAAAFEELVAAGREDLLVRSAQANWLRRTRFVPAVEYLQAQRIRQLIIQDMARMMERVDVYLAPTASNENSLLTNLTGHPAVCVPNGFATNGMPTSITFIGRLFGEAEMLAAARAYQEATAFHRQHPKMDFSLAKPEPAAVKPGQ